MDPRLPSLLVGSQIPEHIRVDYPRFVEFLEAYYDFLQAYNSRIEKLRDINQTAQDFITFLRSEFAARYPQAMIDDRKLIAIIRNLYRTKGTLGGVELLFRIFFNEAVIVQQPGKNILRASDGRWSQEYSITLDQAYLKQDYKIDFSSPIVLRVRNNSGEFFVEVDRADVITETVTRFFFKINKNVIFDPNQYVDILDDSGEILYRGKLIKSPSRLEISSPGKNWKVGQVIIVKSAFNEALDPTIARVTEVGPEGELVNLEIIQYGVDHAENQIILASPYQVKPVSTSYDYVSIPRITPGGEVYYEHTLTLNSYVDQISEIIQGVSSAVSLQNAYFLENYAAEEYNAATVITQLIETSAESTGTNYNTDLTLEEWIASRATLLYKFDYVIKYRGTFVDDRGQLSNTNMRLQDNYFYQMFSYVVESSLNINDYRGAVNMIHPAGLKLFGELAKTAIILKPEYSVLRTLSLNTVYLDDSSILDDNNEILLTKPIDDFIQNVSDQITSFFVSKVLSEQALIDDGSDSINIETIIYQAEDFTGEAYVSDETFITIG